MKQHFKVFLYEDSNELCKTLVNIAAKANGTKTDLSLQELKTVAKAEIMMWPSLNADTSCEIIGDDYLHIDRKIGAEWKTVCRIESSLLFELPQPKKTVETENN